MAMMMDDPAKVNELETELIEVRSAFEDYIASSRELENGLDRELGDMHGRLATSSTANEKLGTQLEKMEPMLRNLEMSLQISKKKLREEARLRRQAELAQVAMEARFQESEKNTTSLRTENESLREECDALHEELAFKCRELEDNKKDQTANRDKLAELGNRIESTKQKREEASIRTDSAMNDTVTDSSKTKSESHLDDSYAEVLDELETVTEQLIQTQQKLWKTEDKLRETESRVRDSETGRKNIKGATGEESKETSANSLEQSEEKGTITDAEKRLMDDLSIMKDELAVAHEELKIAEEQASSCQDRLATMDKSRSIVDVENHRSSIDKLKQQVFEFKESAEMTQEQLTGYEEIVEEGREENVRLIEEIACLRMLLHDQPDPETSTEEQTVPSEEREMIEKQLKEKQLTGYEEIVEEGREENVRLIEEIACLRMLLHDQPHPETSTEEQTVPFEERKMIEKQLKEKILREANKEREREINLLRDKFKKIFKENAALQQKIDEVEGDSPLAASRKEEVSKLKQETFRLKTSLKDAQENHRSVLLETETQWRSKLEKVLGDSQEFLEEQMAEVSQENDALHETVDDFERAIIKARKENGKISEQQLLAEENLKASRDEILKLKKKIGILNTDLQHSLRTIKRMDFESEKMREQYSEVKAELEVAQEVIEESGLDEETINREDTRVLKQKINALTSALDKVQQDYADLEIEFQGNRRQFYESQEEASRRSDDEIEYLTRKLADLEGALENSKIDHSDISVKLQNAKKQCQDALKEGEKKGREVTARKLKSHQSTERKLVMSKFEDLAGEKNHLEKQLEDSDGTVTSIVRDLGEARDALGPLEAELSDCQELLARTRIENMELKEELENSKKGRQVLDKFFGVSNLNTRDAPDPDPISPDRDGSDAFETFQKSRADMMQGRAYAKDPPVSRGTLIVTSLVTDEREDRNIGKLRSQLLDVTLENELLKDKIECLGSGESNHSREWSTVSSTTETAKLKEQVNALQLCLEGVEARSVELDDLERKLKDADTQLNAKETALQASESQLSKTKEENSTLKAEILGLKDAVIGARKNHADAKAELDEAKSRNKEIEKEIEIRGRESIEEVRTMIADERDSEFYHLREELKKLTEEKAALQHQVDDSKIALSVSQYAQERNKEELRARESKLGTSMEEVYKLKNELTSMDKKIMELQNHEDEAQRELRIAHQRSEMQTQTRDEATTLTKQLRQLAEDNAGLQHMVIELEEALLLSQKEMNRRGEEIGSLENSLVSTQEETRLLTEEISHLSTAFETAKVEYDSVVDELEAVNELFEEARQEAERSGREAAKDEIRTEMHSAREQERKVMKTQLRKVFEENSALQRKVDDVETRFSEAKQMRKQDHEFALLRKEVQILRQALKSSAEEVKNLKEKEFNSSLALRESKKELRRQQEEFELVTSSFDDSRREFERTARDTAVEEFQSVVESSEHHMLRDHLKRLINDSENINLKSSSADSDSGHKAEGLRLKVELLDMSMSLEKLISENSVLEEELERVKSDINEARTDGEKQGKAKATKAIRTVMKSEREREMKEFREQFNELVQENGSLEQKYKEVEIALAVAKDSQERSKSELCRLEDELKVSKGGTRKFQEEVFSLTVELESANEDHERVMEEIRSMMKSDRDAKVKAVKHQLAALSIENASLQQKLRSAGAALATTQNFEGRNKGELEASILSLQQSQENVRRLEGEVSQLTFALGSNKAENKTASDEMERKLSEAQSALSLAQSSMVVKEKTLDELNTQLSSSRNETSELNSKISNLSQESASKDLVDNNEVALLREQLQNIVVEKATLQQQVDDARISISLSKYTQDRNQEELKSFQKQLQFTKEEATVQKVDLTSRNSELLKSREEHSTTLNVLGKINQILDSVEGVNGESHTSFVGVNETKNYCSTCIENSRSLNDRMKRAETILSIAKDIENSQAFNLQTSEASLMSTSQKAEETRQKIFTLTLILQKSKREHTEVLSELQALKTQTETSRQISDGGAETEIISSRVRIKTITAENALLEKKVEDTEAALKMARESQRKQNKELDFYELKYAEAKKEASQFKNEVLQLQRTLENAQHDHISLRQQLESVNARVAHMCAEAEARGKAEATKELQAGLNTLEQRERSELMAQFKVFYEENLALQTKLDETETALAASRRVEDKQKAELKQIEENSKANCEKAVQLETVNQFLQLELGSLKQDLDGAKSNRDIVMGELELIKSRLAEVRGHGKIEETGTTHDSDSLTTTSERDAELRLLQDQFKKLSAQSASLGRKVVDAESAVSVIREKQEKTKGDSRLRVKKTIDLQDTIAKAIEESKSRDEEIGTLSVMMGSKVSMTAENVKKLEQDISVAKGKLHVTEAGLFMGRRPKTKEHGSSKAIVAKRPETLTMDSSMQSSGQTPPDGCSSPVHSIKRTRSKSPVPEVPRREEAGTNLTARALEAIARGKKNASQRKFDFKTAQAKIFGTDKHKKVARTTPFGNRFVPKQAVEETRAQTLDSRDSTISGRE